jgi:hypothetical protein
MATTDDGKKKARASSPKSSATEKKTATAQGSAPRKKAGSRKKSKKKGAKGQEEPTPVFSGRLMLAAVALAAMVMIPFTGIGNMLERKVSTPDDLTEW